MKPWMLRALLAAFLSWSGAGAQALVLAVNEGVTYRVPNEEIRAHYAAIAVDIGKLLGQSVTVEPVGDYNQLRKGLADKSYDLAIVHPAHVSIGALRQGWQLVAVTKGFESYSANFLVRADSPLKSLADLRGCKLGAPDEDSITAWMVRATMRDALSDTHAVAITYTRYQDAVPFMVENRFIQAGATASVAVVKAWLAQGGKVLAQSKPIPIKHFIAAPSIKPEQVVRLREYLLALDGSDEGRKKLEPIRIKGYMAWDSAALLSLGRWLGL